MPTDYRSTTEVLADLRLAIIRAEVEAERAEREARAYADRINRRYGIK